MKNKKRLVSEVYVTPSKFANDKGTVIETRIGCCPMCGRKFSKIMWGFYEVLRGVRLFRLDDFSFYRL